MSQDKHLIISRDGYPLQIESVQTLNDAAQQALTSVAAVCGSNTILKGCENVQREGNMYVNDGIVCIDGKIYQFKGGLKTGGVTIITDKVDDIYDTGDGSAKQMLPVRAFTYATGSAMGSVNIPWTSFVAISDLKQVKDVLDGFKNSLNSVQTDIKELYGDKILKKGINQADLTGTSDWIWINVSLPKNNEHDYVISANVVINRKDINDIKSKYSLDIFNKEKSGFSIFVKRLSGAGDNITIEYLAVKHKRGLID